MYSRESRETGIPAHPRWYFRISILSASWALTKRRDDIVVADMVANIVADMVADNDVDMVANMEVDVIADMMATIFLAELF